ncbi:heat shock factor protein 4 [Xenopus laevis]|uniref:Heat shock factor protein 4 n=2 Tax=Xenopus laevis TaxID=8355 RepID=A0A8J0VAM2_XENLA|nr:heat shock factor protein 4 [Xenopus laevis]
MQESASSLAMDGYCSNVPAFLTKLWTLVEDPETNHLICWSVNGTSFHVFDQGRFAKEVLPKYFKHNNMASFVRQLNMYGFRKVVNIEQGGLVKPERDDTEFQHLYFLQGHEHLLEHIKRKVSVVKNEETKLRHEDVSRLLYELQTLRGQQESSECQMQDMKQHNEVLWREVVSLRQNHLQQQKIINKLMQFLFGQLPPGPTSAGIKRKMPLMLDDGNSTLPLTKFSRHLPVDALHDPYYIQSQTMGSTSALNSPALSAGPIISDVTDAPPTNAVEASHSSEGERGKCLLMIKEEPISPSINGSAGQDVSLNNCNICTDPPVLPVAMVQSILEGKESCSPPQMSTSQLIEGQTRRNPQERPEMSDSLDGSEVSLEGLQLLLRSQQYNMDSAAVLDVFSSGLCVSEWSLSNVDTSLSPMQQLAINLEKSVSEHQPKGLNIQYAIPCPDEMANMAASSSLFAAEENAVSYLSSGTLADESSLNLQQPHEQNE